MSTLTFNNANFFELTDNQLMIVDGGYWFPVVVGVVAAVVIAATPVGAGIAVVYFGAKVAGAVAGGFVAAGTACVAMDWALGKM